MLKQVLKVILLIFFSFPLLISCDKNILPSITFLDSDSNPVQMPYTAQAGSTFNGRMRMVDPNADPIIYAQFDGQDVLSLDTDPEEHILDIPISLVVPENGLEADYLAEVIDNRNGLANATLTLKGLAMNAPNAEIYINDSLVSGSTTVDAEQNYSLRLEADDNVSITKVMLNSVDITNQDTNADPAIFEYSSSKGPPGAGETETLELEVTDDESNTTNASVDVTGEYTTPLIGGLDASVYSFFHDNDTETVETVLSDLTNSSFHIRYDTAVFYVDGNRIGSTTPGGSVNVNDTSLISGENLEVKMELYDGGEEGNLIYTRKEKILDIGNHEPSFPQIRETYQTIDDGFMVASAGHRFVYYMDKEDLDGDDLTLITDFVNVNPDDVSLFDIGSHYGVEFNSSGCTPGAYHIRHRVKDSHYAETDWESARIIVQ